MLTLGLCTTSGCSLFDYAGHCVYNATLFFGGVVRVVCGLQQGELCERHSGLGLRCLKEDLELELTEPLPIYLLMTGIHESALTTDFKY